jgi:nucleotide-binding universal stress UspA family protein
MKILLAYDGFEHSKHALEEAAELATKGFGELTILSVVPEAEAGASKAGGHRWLAPHAHQDVAIAHRYLAEFGVEAEMKIAYGESVEEIRKEAADGDYDFIIVGSHGRGPVGRMFLGSVSTALLEAAPCAVLIVSKDTTVRREPARSLRAIA